MVERSKLEALRAKYQAASGGDIFDPATAKRLEDYVYSAGAREAPEEAWMHFRGRAPDPNALLEKRGLA